MKMTVKELVQKFWEILPDPSNKSNEDVFWKIAEYVDENFIWKQKLLEKIDNMYLIESATSLVNCDWNAALDEIKKELL